MRGVGAQCRSFVVAARAEVYTPTTARFGYVLDD
jgi:hypothetical protein